MQEPEVDRIPSSFSPLNTCCQPPPDMVEHSSTMHVDSWNASAAWADANHQQGLKLEKFYPVVSEADYSNNRNDSLRDSSVVDPNVTSFWPLSDFPAAQRKRRPDRSSACSPLPFPTVKRQKPDSSDTAKCSVGSSSWKPYMPTRRKCLVSFPQLDETVVEGKILMKEPWGFQVQLMGDHPSGKAKRKEKYWCVWQGEVRPFAEAPILKAVHIC